MPEQLFALVITGEAEVIPGDPPQQTDDEPETEPEESQ